MSTAELKLELFRQIDKLDEKQLKDLFALLINLTNSTNDLSGWEALSHEQKEGLGEAIAQMDAGRGIANEKVMAKYKKKFNA